MRKDTFLIISLIALVLLNVWQLAGDWFGKPERPPRHEEGGEYVLRRLHFDRDQADRFKILIDAHKIEVHQHKDELYRRYADLYGLLKTDTLRASVVDSLQNEICRLHRAINDANLAHFKDVKALCRDDQLRNFDFFLDEMLYRLGPE